MHTTSDLLRILAAQERPDQVAAAVEQRFGADPESQAWLGRTLVTLLRDSLLYSEAEKTNAAYLLRFATPDVPGTREALLHLSQPESGEPASVRSFAASLAAAPPQQHQFQQRQEAAHQQFNGLQQQQQLSWQGSPLAAAAAAPPPLNQHRQLASEAPGSLPGSTQSSLTGVPSWLQSMPQLRVPPSPQQQGQPPSPQQHLFQSSSPQPPYQPPSSQQQLYQPPSPQQQLFQPPSPQQQLYQPLSPRQLGQPPSPQPLYQPPSPQPFYQPGSPHQHGQPPPPQPFHQPGSPLQHGEPPSPQQLYQQLQPPSPHHQLFQTLSQQLQPQEPPSPHSLQPGSPLQQLAAQKQQWEQQEGQRQREQQAGHLLALLQQAASSPLVPALQQQLAAALQGPLARTLTEPLARGVAGGLGNGGGGPGLQPKHMQGLTEHNSSVAAELLLALGDHQPEAAAMYAAAVAEMPMSIQSVEVLSAVVHRGSLPDWVLTTFLSNCMQDTNATQDAGRQSRQVKLLCAWVGLVLQRQPATLAESLPELLAFCIQQSRHKQASELYRQLQLAVG